jgi:hypothetical protein
MESRVLSLLHRSLEFGFYHCLLSAVDRVSQLPRNTTMLDAARLYRDNIALKAQLDVLEVRLKWQQEKPKKKRLRVGEHEARLDLELMKWRLCRSPSREPVSGRPGGNPRGIRSGT